MRAFGYRGRGCKGSKVQRYNGKRHTGILVKAAKALEAVEAVSGSREQRARDETRRGSDEVPQGGK